MQVNTKDIKTSGDLGGRKIAMSLDTNSLVHIMSILSDLYSDPAAAVVREYITNALDSHLAAGNTQPVRVFTPSRMSPNFIVQDFGVGMSEADIENIYSQFGNSTKRGNNVEAGMLGLGSKSALTYTEQFTLTSIKDGVKVIALISRSSDGSGGIEIVGSDNTTEANGVTIKVPVNRDIVDFSDKVHSFARYVTPGMILINDVAPDLSDLDFVRPNIALVRKHGYHETDRIVMGNVSYPTQTRLLDTHSVIYYTDMGTVDFTPSREELMFTDLTRDTIRKASEEFDKYFKDHLQSRVEACETVKEAWQLASKFKSDFHRQSYAFTYRGIALPQGTIHIDAAYWYNHNLDNGTVKSFLESINYQMGSFDDMVFVKNWTNKNFTRVQARKMSGYFQSKNLDYQRVYLYDVHKPYAELTANCKVYDWKEIKKFGVAKPAARQKREAKTWEGIGGDASNSRFTFFVPDASKKIYYASRSYTQHSSAHYDLADDDTQFFYVIDSQCDRFLKLYPHAEHVKSYYKNKVADYLNNLTIDDYEFFKYYRAGNRNGLMINWQEVLDPELRKIVRFSEDCDDEVIKRYHAAERAHRRLTWAERDKFKFPEFSEGSDHEDVYGKYPLLTATTYYPWQDNAEAVKDHLTKYVNYVYAEHTATADKKEVTV